MAKIEKCLILEYVLLWPLRKQDFFTELKNIDFSRSYGPEREGIYVGYIGNSLYIENVP